MGRSDASCAFARLRTFNARSVIFPQLRRIYNKKVKTLTNMNKKERFCDVDNIVEWRHIITILFALVAVAGQGQEIKIL